MGCCHSPCALDVDTNIENEFGDDDCVNDINIGLPSHDEFVHLSLDSYIASMESISSSEDFEPATVDDDISFTWRIQQITGKKELIHKEHTKHDPIYDDTIYKVEVKKVSVLKDNDYVWSINVRCSNPNIFVSSVDLIDHCSHDTIGGHTASEQYNGELPKTVYTNTESTFFAVTWKCYIDLKISRQFM